MRGDDGRKLDHKTLETIRVRAVQQFENGARVEEVADTLGFRAPRGLRRAFARRSFRTSARSLRTHLRSVSVEPIPSFAATRRHRRPG